MEQFVYVPIWGANHAVVLRGEGGVEVLHMCGPEEKVVTRDKRELRTEKLRYLLHYANRQTMSE